MNNFDWTYKNKPFIEPIDGYEGFCYMITNIVTRTEIYW